MALAMVIFGLLVWPGLAQDFTNKFRLSTSLPYKAFNPDIAAKGGYVAAVWSEGYDSNSQTKQYGRIYLKGADETSGWKGRVELFDATQDVRGRDPRLVFDPNVPGKVHVVWAQSSECSVINEVLSCSWSSIQHTTCMLGSTIVCNDPTSVRDGLTDASTPDVAVDSSGGVHVVWREQGPSFDVGPIRYCKTGSCGSPSLVGNGQHPSLAYANDYLHLVWDTGSSTDSTIKYAHKSLPSGSWDGAKTWWSHPLPFWVNYYEPSYPALGASGDAVYVVWAVRNKTDSTKYALRFDFFENTGNSWLSDPYGFGSGRSVPENEATSFASTWRSIGIPADDLYSLQPEVVVTGSGSSAYAHMVWQDRDINSGLYRIWYSYLAGYSDTGTWNPPEVAVEEYNKDTELPAIALGETLDQTHLAFVRNAKAGFQDINVWYAGGNGNRINDSDDKISLPLLFKNAR
jgi:hypothetical protein